MHLGGNRRFVLLFIKYLLMLPSILLAQKMQYSKCFYFIRKLCLAGICLPTNKKMFNVAQSLNEFYWFAKKGTDSSSPIQLFKHMLFSGEGLFAGSKLLIKRISRDNSDNYFSENHQLGSYLRNITTAVKLLVASKRGAISLTLVTSSPGKVLKRKKVQRLVCSGKCTQPIQLVYRHSTQILRNK